MNLLWKTSRTGSPRRLRPAFETLEARDTPATFTVRNLADSGTNSLRAALTAANTRAGADVVRFDARLSGAINLAGSIAITDTVTIVGPGAGRVALSGGESNRIFDIFPAIRGEEEPVFGTVVVAGLTLRNGFASSEDGGAIRNFGFDLTLSRCVLSGNVATAADGEGGHGGAVFQLGGTLTVTNCTLQDNVAEGGGGAISQFDGGPPPSMTILRSTFTGNVAGFESDELFSEADGGAIEAVSGTVLIEETTIRGNSLSGFGQGGGVSFRDADAAILRSTIADNSTSSAKSEETSQAGRGAGIAFTEGGLLYLENSTLSGNATSAADGGGIYFDGIQLYAEHVTISANRAGQQSGTGGGIFVAAGTADLHNTLLEDNREAFDVLNDLARNDDEESAIINAGNCLIQAPGSAVNGIDENNIYFLPGDLGDLAFNGGPTPTRALRPGSPAINAGDPDCTCGPPTDQRAAGFRRFVGGRRDIGAFEFRGITGVVTSSAPRARVGQLVTFTATFRILEVGMAVPPGIAIFFVDDRPVGTAAVVGGVARFSTAGLTPGTHRVRAVYVPDSSELFRFDPFSTPAILQLVGGGSVFRHYIR